MKYDVIYKECFPLMKVPEKIDSEISRLKLKSMGITIDVLTPAQKKYLTSWQEGT